MLHVAAKEGRHTCINETRCNEIPGDDEANAKDSSKDAVDGELRVSIW
jgi:hypothetical protein